MTKVNPEIQRQYVEWFKRHEPFWYRVAMKRLDMQSSPSQNMLRGLGVSWSGVFTSLVDTVKEAAPAYLQAKQQKEIMEMQLKRAEKGLPPANIDDYTPSVKIQPTITPETEQAITRVATQSLQSGLTKALPWIAGIVGAVLLLPMLLRGGSSGRSGRR